MTEENLTYEQTLDRTSKRLIRLAKIWKINVSHTSNAIQYILVYFFIKFSEQKRAYTSGEQAI